MIRNYLDFVKRQRARALQEARRTRDKLLGMKDEWGKGFYRGMQLAFEFESRHWRTLQKDMEKSLAKCDDLSAEDTGR